MRKIKKMRKILGIAVIVFVFLNVLIFNLYAEEATPYVSLKFPGETSLSGEGAGSTISFFDENGDNNRNNSEISYGTDTHGTYLRWESSKPRGGGFKLEVDKVLNDEYTIGVKFSFDTTSGTWRKIIDYENSVSDNGFYFYDNGHLRFYPEDLSSTRSISDNEVVNFIIVRSRTAFSVYLVKDDGEIVREFHSTSYTTLRDSKPHVENGKTILGFFFDDVATSGEATNGGRIYSLAIYDKAVDPTLVNDKLDEKAANDSNEPILKDSLPTVETGSTPSAEEFIKNTPASNEVNKLPEGTRIEWKENASPDTATPGEKDATILVTYPDNSTDEVNLKVTVISKADSNEPILKDSLPTVEKGSTPSAEEFIKNTPASNEINKLPEGTKIEWKENRSPDTSTSGEKDATILVTYPDGSKKEINLKVTVISKADSNEPILKVSLPEVEKGSSATNIPKTSDNTNIILHFYILIVSLVLITIIIVFEFAHSLSTKLNNKQ